MKLFCDTLFYWIALRAAWHTNWMNFSQPEDRDSEQVKLMCHHLAFRSHCEIHKQLAAGFAELREKGRVFSQRGLSQRLTLRYKAPWWQIDTVAWLLQHRYSRSPHSRQSPLSLQSPWESHTALESKWNKQWTFLCLLHVVVLSFRRRQMWTKSCTDFSLLHNLRGVRAAGRRKKKWGKSVSCLKFHGVQY